MKKLTAKEARNLADRLMVDINGDGITFYATNDDESEILSFDSKKERDKFVDKCNNRSKQNGYDK